MMSRSSSNWLVLPVVSLLLCCLATLDTAEGVQCYVCSWSPTDTNRIDVCTRNNFTESVRTHNCDQGCESVTVFDKTGKMEFFYRNCASNATSPVTACHNETNKAITKEVCSCNTDLCNSGSHLELLGGVATLLFALMAIRL